MGVSSAVRGAAGHKGITTLLLGGARRRRPHHHHHHHTICKHKAVRVAHSEPPYCPNASWMGSKNTSFAAKSCACAPSRNHLTSASVGSINTTAGRLALLSVNL